MVRAMVPYPTQIGPVQIDVRNNGMEICFRRRNWWHFLLFLVMFPIFAAIGSMAVASFVQTHNWLAMGIGLPFATMAFVMGMSLVWLLVGEERLLLNQLGCGYELRVILCWKRRLVPLTELKRATADYSRSGREPELEIKTLGRSIRMGRGADSRTLDALAQTVNRFLRELGAGHPASEVGDHTAPPGESTLQVKQAADVLQIRRRGRWSTTRLFEFTVLTLLTGSIVGAAATLLVQKGKALELILLTPFFVMAVLPAFAWFRAVLEPAFSVEWQFRRDELRYCRRFFGLGIWRTVLLPPLDSVQVRRFGSPWRTLLKKIRFDGGSSFFVPIDDGGHAVALMGTRRQQIARIDGLTEGEARWLCAVVRQDYTNWFASSEK